ncbi:MAG: RnfABCDGE type electron transport complex subunit D [Parcubacteria group bacterium]
MTTIDNFLNKITMYKLVLYGLFILVFVSIAFSLFGFIYYGAISLVGTLVLLFLTTYFSNFLFAKIFKVETNAESSAITALILFFILFPGKSFYDFLFIALIGFLAMASKYIFAINKKHIFNPVAIAVFLPALFGMGMGAWWVGSISLLAPVAILGFLILRKVRRFELFFSFLVTAILTNILFAYTLGQNLTEVFMASFVSGPAIFFGSIMLTEPLTTPPTKKMQMVYGLLVGGLFGAQFNIGPIYSSPELALIVGNLFSFIISPKDKLVLKLVSKSTINANGDVDEFRFEPNKKLSFKAGQYLEWTLGVNKPDSRGNRRYFTIASSPTENEIKLGVKYYDKSSSFKLRLGELKVGEKIYAGSLAGEFILPDDKAQKMVWIAGGIGVTPFRAMAKYIIDTEQKRDVVLFYSNKTSKDIAYKDIFDEAETKTGLRTLYVVNSAQESLKSNERVGMVTSEMIMKEVPDYKERIYFISGPHVMVEAFKDALNKMGIPKKNIKVDFFPGFV